MFIRSMLALCLLNSTVSALAMSMTLHHAVLTGNVFALKQVLAMPTLDLNALDRNCRTALHLAAGT